MGPGKHGTQTERNQTNNAKAPPPSPLPPPNASHMSHAASPAPPGGLSRAEQPRSLQARGQANGARVSVKAARGDVYRSVHGSPGLAHSQDSL